MTLKELVIELPAIKDEAKVLLGDNYMGKLMLIINSDEPHKYLKELLDERARTSSKA